MLSASRWRAISGASSDGYSSGAPFEQGVAVCVYDFPNESKLQIAPMNYIVNIRIVSSLLSEYQSHQLFVYLGTPVPLLYLCIPLVKIFLALF